MKNKDKRKYCVIEGKEAKARRNGKKILGYKKNENEKGKVKIK